MKKKTLFNDKKKRQKTEFNDFSIVTFISAGEYGMYFQFQSGYQLIFTLGRISNGMRVFFFHFNPQRPSLIYCLTTNNCFSELNMKYVKFKNQIFMKIMINLVKIENYYILWCFIRNSFELIVFLIIRVDHYFLIALIFNLKI